MPKKIAPKIFLFKVRDYTTEIVGQFDESKDCYYVERGDGTRYEYKSYRCEWVKPIN